MTPRNPQPPSAGDPEDHESTGDRQRHESSPRPSLSARSRGEGWDVPEGGLAKYRSRWRAAARFVLQRGIFRLVMHSAITPSSEVHRRVRSVRGPYVLVANHTSHIDAPLLAESLPWSQARYLSTGVASDYLFTHRPRRWWCARCSTPSPSTATAPASTRAPRAACCARVCRSWCSPRAGARPTAG